MACFSRESTFKWVISRWCHAQVVISRQTKIITQTLSANSAKRLRWVIFISFFEHTLVAFVSTKATRALFFIWNWVELLTLYHLFLHSNQCLSVCLLVMFGWLEVETLFVAFLLRVTVIELLAWIQAWGVIGEWLALVTSLQFIINSFLVNNGFSVEHWVDICNHGD